MTQEQFNKVCEIVREIDSLESAKKEISKKEAESLLYGQDISLRFCRWDGYNDGKCEIMNIKALFSILRRHEELIRQEIEDRINELKKEIEEI